MAEQCFVEIVRYEGEKVERRMGPMSRHSAEKVDGGANINLDHERFYTRIVSEEPKGEGECASHQSI